MPDYPGAFLRKKQWHANTYFCCFTNLWHAKSMFWSKIDYFSEFYGMQGMHGMLAKTPLRLSLSVALHSGMKVCNKFLSKIVKIHDFRAFLGLVWQF